MRVTLVTESYVPQVNGVSRALSELVRVLTEAGDAVQVVHPDYGSPGMGASDHLVAAVNPPFYPELFLPIPPFGSTRRAIDAFQPDLMHIATEATLGLSALRHARRRLIPTVSSFHTNFDQYSTYYGFGWTKGLIWRYLRWFHNRTLQTYVPSSSTADALKARGFERLALWPRGVDSRLFRPDRAGRATVRETLGFAPDDVVIGHVSRIATEKNIDYLADALERTKAARPKVKLLIVGDGPARPGLETRLGLRARFVGYRSGDDLADHYAAADLFAFASRTETFGNVVLEAMASALPVVAVRAGGPGDTVRDSQTGFLIEPDAPSDQFAAALVRLIDDPPLRRSMAAAARSYALTRPWDAIMMTLRERYQDILNQPLLEPAS